MNKLSWLGKYGCKAETVSVRPGPGRGPQHEIRERALRVPSQKSTLFEGAKIFFKNDLV